MVKYILFFLYGASSIFSAMIAWLFWHRERNMLSMLVVALMTIVAAGFLKDAIISLRSFSSAAFSVCLSNAIDILAVPLYAAILIELCNPGRITLKNVLLMESPFVLLLLLQTVFQSKVFYYADMTLAIVFGILMAIWASVAIPRYHRHLKTAFSYDENINLHWLQSILWTFFVLLSMWAVSCIADSLWIDALYIVTALVLWIFICYFIYRHKSVVDELTPIAVEEIKTEIPAQAGNEVFDRIRKLIIEERIYLNPSLKLSDIAKAANTNRAYASAFFSTDAQTTFYDYINHLRVDHAKQLLADARLRIDDIAERSGFNSRRSFHRVFLAFTGKTPADYRQLLQTPQIS